jgi:hypothetical protein
VICREQAVEAQHRSSNAATQMIPAAIRLRSRAGSDAERKQEHGEDKEPEDQPMSLPCRSGA